MKAPDIGVEESKAEKCGRPVPRQTSSSEQQPQQQPARSNAIQFQWARSGASGGPPPPPDFEPWPIRRTVPYRPCTTTSHPCRPRLQRLTNPDSASANRLVCVAKCLTLVHGLTVYRPPSSLSTGPAAKSPSARLPAKCFVCGFCTNPLSRMGMVKQRTGLLCALTMDRWSACHPQTRSVAC